MDSLFHDDVHNTSNGKLCSHCTKKIPRFVSDQSGSIAADLTQRAKKKGGGGDN